MPNPTYVARLRLASLACAAAAAAWGAAALLGWITGNEALKGHFGAGITMKTNAALGVLLISSAIASSHYARARASVTFARLSRGLALVAAILGLLTLAEHLFAVDFGIDQLIFEEPAGAAATQSPNRMGPVGSLCLLLLGSSCLLADVESRRGGAPFQRLALLVMLITSVPLLGYLFGAAALFGIGRYTGIALPTALALWLLAMALVLSRPDAGFMRRLIARDSGALLMRRLLPAAVFLPILLMLLRISGQELGVYDQPLGRALLVMSIMVVFTAVVWRTGDAAFRQETAAAAAERELHERLVHSLEQFRTLGEAVPDLLWMSDARGAPLYQNRAWTTYTGLDADATRTAGWEPLLHPEDLPRMRELRAASAADGTPFQLEARLAGRNGTYQWFTLRTVPVKDETHRVSKWIGAGTDIDEEKRGRDALADADRRKTEFLAVLAHELRNPLAPVRNAVHYLRARDGVDAESARAFAVIERQVEHLARLIDDLMDVNRISQDKLELRTSVARLSEIIAGAVDANRYLLEANRHQIALTLPEHEIHLQADAARLVQVFSNLLTNAARYTPPGGRITLVAEHHPMGAASGELRVSITDTGVGISAQQLPHIFEMFFQVENSEQRGRHGLGIGLALVKKLVELHGGSVTARSTGAGEGSTFTVSLPGAEAVTAPGAPSSSPASSLPHFDGLTVLVVDDNQDSAEMLTTFLAMTAADVRTAYDGRGALALAAELRPRVILLDIGLPDMSGYEVARELRATPWGASALIIALTGWGQTEDRARSQQAGFDLHLVKPVDPDAIVARIVEYRSAGPAVPRAPASQPLAGPAA